MKVSDYVIDRISRETNHVFMVVGGGGMHLFDSLGKHPSLSYVCNHHEQACAFAAEGYARATGKIGVVLITTGPGGTNCLTGVSCAWNDSIPLVFISGQVNSTIREKLYNQRQKGVQECDIVAIVKPITKYAVTVEKAEDIPQILEQALHIARVGRPGPVWIDIPVDIQSVDIEVEDVVHIPFDFGNHIFDDISFVYEKMEQAKKPLILVGHGVRLDHAVDSVLELSRRHSIPIVTTKNGFDCVHNCFPFNMGTIGINGNLFANKAIQNCDFLLIFGARLSQPTVGYNYSSFAKNAYKVQVDIDTPSLNNPLIPIDKKYRARIMQFLSSLLLWQHHITPKEEWLDQCSAWKDCFPTVAKHWFNDRYVNSYKFFDRLSDFTTDHDIIITDQGASFYSFTQAYRVRKGQRAFTNGGFSPMGYGLPAAIGAAIAYEGQRRVICVHGDGGLQMNLQELQTMVHHKLPIKLFVFNNKGYLSIVHTQDAFFDGNYVGCTYDSGISFPDLRAIAKAYKIPYNRLEKDFDIPMLSRILSNDKMEIIEVLLDPHQAYSPKVTSRVGEDGKMFTPPLDDMLCV